MDEIKNFCGPANEAAFIPDLFWTAGTDEGSEGFFGFATTKTLLPRNAKLKPKN
jgi:hypothetical protein